MGSPRLDCLEAEEKVGGSAASCFTQRVGLSQRNASNWAGRGPWGHELSGYGEMRPQGLEP